MSQELTPWYISAVIIAEVAAVISIWHIEKRAGSPVDGCAMFVALEFVMLVAFGVYALVR